MLVEAILANGAAVEVSRISAETHDMIAIEGMCDGTRCLLLAHQSSIQLLCTFNKREPETPPKAPIGFFVGDQQIK